MAARAEKSLSWKKDFLIGGDNAAVRAWSERTQQEKGDSLTEGYESELWDFTRISVTQNDLQELRDIWNSWKAKSSNSFTFWGSAYSCFTFGGGVDLYPLWRIHGADRAYLRPVNVLPFLKKLMNITGMSDLYDLIAFPKALGHIDEVVSDLFDRLDKGTTPIPVILAETFRSLNACRRAGEGRFIGYAQLLLVWFHSHFWKVEKNLWVEDIEWRAPWLIPDAILYRCGDFDWVPLAGIWGAVGYAPLMVLRQYRSRQFIQVTQGLAQCEFSYKDDNYKRRVREISDAWNQTRRMKDRSQAR
ncbi:hypothetical protein CXB51_003190 [Gossypium anomalum]|uniref:DUF7745 domain-containing protein n=1 Tax=Gossypium anomalum TaxID=47600 RepID=A0A8J5Z249_9ROSI|nr:hypothetical protein CXB51_003190 [Gossypium anomalum]